MQEVLINTGAALNLQEFPDQPLIPTGVHYPEFVFLNEQRQFVEPVEEVVPFMGVAIKLLKGFPDQPVMAFIVIAKVGSSTARACQGAISQRVVFVITHHNSGGPLVDHVPDQMQGLPDTGPPINNIADENGLASAVMINA